MPGGRRGRWVGAAELGEFAYCPRAHWYSQHPPAFPIPPEAEARREHGRGSHAEGLRRTRVISGRRGTYTLIMLLAIGLAGLALWVAGVG